MRTLKNLLIGSAMVLMLLPATLSAQRSGVEIWSQNCGNCHTAQPPTRYRKDQWPSVITHMTIQARLTSDEAKAVLEFLQSGAKTTRSAQIKEHESVQLASEDPSFVPLEPIDGKTIFSSQCVACHGKAGKGDGPAAVAFNPKPADFTRPDFARDTTDARLQEIIAKGKGNMPAFGATLRPEEIEAVVTYIRSLRKADD